MGRLTLILGGARSGKSTYAEKLARRCTGSVAYIATAEAQDEEMARRIDTHRSSRPSNWTTLEISSGVGKVLLEKPLSADLVLLDCLTLLVSNLALTATTDLEAPDEPAIAVLVRAEVEQLLAAIAASPAQWIIVTNEVGLGVVPAFPIGRIYRDWLGWANQRIAQAADQIIFMLAGLPMRLQPDPDDA